MENSTECDLDAGLIIPLIFDYYLFPSAIVNGTSLGWLIDRITRQVYIYQPNKDLQCLDNPQTVSGDPMLSGFILDLTKIW